MGDFEAEKAENEEKRPKSSCKGSEKAKLDAQKPKFRPSYAAWKLHRPDKGQKLLPETAGEYLLQTRSSKKRRRRVFLPPGSIKRPPVKQPQLIYHPRKTNEEKVQLKTYNNSYRRLFIRDEKGRIMTVAKRMDQSVKTFYEHVELPEFKASLEAAADPRYQMLLKAMMSPKHSRMSFANLARKCQLTLRELNDVWRDHQMHTGMLRMLRHLPDVMEDIAEDSKTRKLACLDCDGTGRDPKAKEGTPGICRTCRGDGVIREMGDSKSRELLFEAAGLRKGAPLVNMNFNSAQTPAYEDTLKNISGVFDVTPVTVKKEEKDEKPAPELRESGPGGDGTTTSPDR